MDENELRKRILAGNKTERLVFAVTPRMKSAMEKLAEEKCTSVSAILTSLSLDEVLANKELFDDGTE